MVVGWRKEGFVEGEIGQIVGWRKEGFVGGENGQVLKVTVEDIRLILNIHCRGLLIELKVTNHDTQLFRDHLKGYSMISMHTV